MVGGLFGGVEGGVNRLRNSRDLDLGRAALAVHNLRWDRPIFWTAFILVGNLGVGGAP